MTYYNSPNRYVCDTLSEMRKQLETVDVDTLERYRKSMAYLIEEAQTLVNRMEAALYDWKDLKRLTEKVQKAKEKLKKLEEKLPERDDD